MRKTVTIIIVLILAALLIITLLLWQSEKQNLRMQQVNKIEEIQRGHLDKLSEVIANYNDLYASYQELYQEYHQLAAEKGFYDEWEPYTVTAYTSLDEGCNDISSIGMDISRWSEYFNFAAVDPELIPYGAIVLVKFQTGIEPFLAVDCGGAINGKHLDLYYQKDLSKAFDFGVKELEVKVVR